jgi:hypothetical protein
MVSKGMNPETEMAAYGTHGTNGKLEGGRDRCSGDSENAEIGRTQKWLLRSD